MFKQIIAQIRLNRNKQTSENPQVQQLPFSLNIMVEYILNREMRKSLIEQIEGFDGSSCKQLFSQLEHLFSQSIL